MGTIPWWIWAIVAAAIALGELHAPGSYLVWIAIGAALTAAVEAAWEMAIPAQIGTFAAASALSCIAGYFVYRGLNVSRLGAAPLNQRDLLMIGAQGVVCEALANGRGKVRLGDTVWLAEGAALSEGTSVVVKGVRGTSLLVEAAEPRAEVGRPNDVTAA